MTTMTCPHCGILLGERFPRPASCPSCQLTVPGDPVEPGNITVADHPPSNAALNATIDSIPSIEPQAPSQPPTVHINIAATIDSWTTEAPVSEPPTVPIHPRVAQTVDSDSGFSISPPTGPVASLTANDRRIAQTIDSHELSIDVRQVTGIWSKTLPPDAKPHHTIKGEEQHSPKDSKLVIKSRALKTVTHEQPTGADYELLGVIGEGGMGVVYAGRQASIDRNVAIKMLKPDGARDFERREKFLSEAVVTGELDHPNIVPIYDLGANEQNALFYSMKRVVGTPWSKVIEQKTQAENLEALMKVADAVGFAHSRGVVHRDLKPENIMLGDFGEVLVMDWGLALSTPQFRKTDSITQTTSMGGTPAYMAPEMATGPIDRVGIPSDIYLLGAILYEIVARKPPHAGESVMSCLQAAAKNQIQPTEASGELLEIALRAMASNPSDRYPSVRDFQNAIRLYQDHSESIALAVRAERDLAEATKADNYQQFSRALFAFEESLGLWDGNHQARSGARTARLAYARSADRKGDYDLAASLLTGDDAEQIELREKVLAAARERDARQGRLRNAKRLLVALASVVVVVITGAYFHAVRAQRIAESARSEAVKQKNAADVARAEEEKQKQAADAARAIAERAKQAEEYEAYVARIGLAAAKIEENSFGYAEQLLAECPAEYRNWEWGRLKFLCEQGVRSYHCDSPVDAVAFSPDGRRFITGSWDGTVRIWDTASGEMLRALPYGALYVHGVAWSPSGQLIAAAGNDPQGGVKVWNAETGNLQQTLRGHTDGVLSVVFSKNSKQLLTTSYDNTARLWNVEDGAEQRKFEGHSWWVWSAAFSPDETRVATASQDGTVRLWQVANSTDAEATAPAVFTGHHGPVYSVAFSHDGKQLVSGGYDNRVLLWQPGDIHPFDYKRILSGEEAASSFTACEGHNGPVRSVQFSRDDKLIVSAAHDNTVRVWDATNAKAIKILRGHAGWARACAFSPDSHSLLSASHDYQAKLWSIAGYEEMRVLRGRVLEGHDDAIFAASFSRDGSKIATASRDRTAKTWDVATGEELHTFREGHEFLASSAAFSRDGKRLATAAIDNTTRLWDVATGTQQFVLDGTGRSAALALSPDGVLVLTGSTDRNAKLWDANTGKLLHTLEELRSEVTAVAFSPNGDTFCTGDVAGRIHLWETESRRELWSAAHHNGRITAAAFTPDGKRLLTACMDKTVGQWEVSSGKELSSLVLKHSDSVVSLAVDPRGKFIITSSVDNKAYVWSLDDARVLASFESPEARINAVAISPDGRRILTVGDTPIENLENQKDKTKERRPLVRLWDLSTGKSIDDIKVRGTQVWASVFTPDGGGVLTVGGNDARLWDLTTGIQRMSFSPHGAVASVNFSPDGQRLVTASWDNSARIWNIATGKSELKLTDAHTRAVNAALFLPDGLHVLTASDDKTLKLWDAANGKVVKSYEGHADRVRCAALSVDGQLALTGSNDKTARIWNIQSGEIAQTLKGHEWAVTSAVFNMDASRVLTGSEDKSAKLWNVQTGECLLTLQGHTAAVVSVALSPDGRRALTASQDNICKVWDAVTGKEILTLKGHTQELTSASFSDDGRYVLTASRDGTAIVWLTSPW